MLSGSRTTGRVRAYGCHWHRTRGKAVCPIAWLHPTSEVEAALAEYLRREVLTPALLAEIMAEVRAEASRALREHSTDATAIESELEALRAELKNLARAVAVGGEQIPELVKEMQARNARLRRLEANLEVARRSPAMVDELCAKVEARARERLNAVRQALSSADPMEAREVYQAMFPEGLVFDLVEEPVPGRRLPRRGWAIKGMARPDKFILTSDPTGT